MDAPRFLTQFRAVEPETSRVVFRRGGWGVGNLVRRGTRGLTSPPPSMYGLVVHRDDRRRGKLSTRLPKDLAIYARPFTG